MDLERSSSESDAPGWPGESNQLILSTPDTLSLKCQTQAMTRLCAVLFLGISIVAGCRSEEPVTEPCGGVSCWPPSVFVNLAELEGARSVEICINEDCAVAEERSISSHASSDEYNFQFSREIDWAAGDDVVVSIKVINESGATIGAVSESRAMTEDCFPCPAFFYRWTDLGFVQSSDV